MAVLEAELQALRTKNETLELENRTIRKGMSNCCTDATFDLTLEQSFLLQNAPNFKKQMFQCCIPMFMIC